MFLFKTSNKFNIKNLEIIPIKYDTVPIKFNAVEHQSMAIETFCRIYEAYLIQTFCQFHESKQHKVSAQFDFDTLWAMCFDTTWPNQLHKYSITKSY